MNKTFKAFSKKLCSNLFRYLFITFIFLHCNFSAAQWQKTNGPYGGARVEHIISNGTNLFCSTYNNIYLSTDNGINWKAVNSGLPDASGLRAFFCLGSNQGSVYAGTFVGIYGSNNNGGSWEVLNGNNELNTRITSLGFLDTIIFAGTQSTESSGIYRSTDNGISWARVDSFFYNIYVDSFLPRNDTIFAGLNGGGLLRSTDQGQTWELLDSAGISSSFIVGMLIKNNIIYVMTSIGLYCSANTGVSWTRVSEIGGILTFTAIGDYLLAGSDSGVGVLLSKDNGKTWTTMNNGIINSNAISVSSLASVNGRLFASTPDGLFISNDTAKSWSIVNLRTTETTVHSIVNNDDGTLYAGTESGFFRSTNKGKDWVAASTGLSSFIVYCVTMQDSNLFAGTANGILRSSNKGTAWSASSDGLNTNVIRSITVHGSDMFAAGNNALYKSTDSGENWTPLNIGFTPIKTSSIIIDKQNIFAGAVNGIFRSTDYGLNWEQANTGLTDQYITSLLSVDGKLFAGTYLHGVFCSTNNGDKWSSVPFLSSQAVHSLAEFNNLFLFVGTDYGTKIYSLKDSSLITGFQSGMPSTISIYSLALQDSILYAGAYENGIWSCPVAGLLTGIEKDFSNYPAEFQLYQNYPNPFNPITTIEFQVPRAENVSLRVFDIIGREVKTLINEEKSLGTYKIRFNGKNLPSGVYFYRLEAGNFASTKKLILMK